MPEMGGIEATAEIRKLSKKLPVIVGLTADGSAENRQRCLAAGMNEFLTKPVRRAELLRVLSQYQGSWYKQTCF